MAQKNPKQLVQLLMQIPELKLLLKSPFSNEQLMLKPKELKSSVPLLEAAKRLKSKAESNKRLKRMAEIAKKLPSFNNSKVQTLGCHESDLEFLANEDFET